MFLKSKITVNSNSRNFSLEFPSIEEFLILMDFKLDGVGNKLHLEGFTLKLL